MKNENSSTVIDGLCIVTPIGTVTTPKGSATVALLSGPVDKRVQLAIGSAELDLDEAEAIRLLEHLSRGLHILEEARGAGPTCFSVSGHSHIVRRRGELSS
jgi:hypothetical protein